MFKKLAVILLVLSIFLAPALAQEWKLLNKATVSWDPVTQLADGKPVPTSDTMEYEVLLAKIDKANPVSLWRGTATSATITINDEGRYLLGVKAYRMADGVQAGESEIAWSDDPASTNNAPFGIVKYSPPIKPGGFNLQ